MMGTGGSEASMNESRFFDFFTGDVRTRDGSLRAGFAQSGIFISTCLGTERALFGRRSCDNALVAFKNPGESLPPEKYDEKDTDPESEGAEGT